MNVMILDAGNSLIKAKTAKTEQVFPHAIKELSESDYQNIQTRSGKSGAPIDYIKVNGRSYAIGEQAERHGALTRRTGTARYTKDYYGVFVASMLARCFDKDGAISVFGSHPPGDINFRDDLMEAAAGLYEIESAGKELTFKVNYVNTFDEPAGGLFNVILAADGVHYAHSDLNGGRSLVIDIGGFTTDWLAVNPGGEVDYSLNESTPIGVLAAIKDFEKSFRANNRDAVKDTPVLPPDRVRNAISTGIYVGGGRRYPCQVEADEAVSMLVNRITDTFQNTAGGALLWDSIVLTGGGSALLYERLKPVLKHDRLLLADNPDSLHLANVRGGLKLWKLYEHDGLL